MPSPNVLQVIYRSLLLLLFFVLAPIASAQPLTDWWVNAAVGVGTEPYYGSSLSLNVGDVTTYQLYLHHGSTYASCSRACSPPSGIESLTTLSAGIGRRHFGGSILAVFVGPAVVWGEERLGEVVGESRWERYLVPGLVANAQAIVGIAPELGFGLDFYGTWNRKQSAVGLKLALTLGFGHSQR